MCSLCFCQISFFFLQSKKRDDKKTILQARKSPLFPHFFSLSLESQQTVKINKPSLFSFFAKSFLLMFAVTHAATGCLNITAKVNLPPEKIACDSSQREHVQLKLSCEPHKRRQLILPVFSLFPPPPSSPSSSDMLGLFHFAGFGDSSVFILLVGLWGPRE